MARKRLTKGANALRVEERIAMVPRDVARPAEGETGIFRALKALESDGGPVPEPRRPARASAKGASAKIAAAKSASPRRPAAKPAAAKIAAAKPATEPSGASARLGPLSFTEAERGAIVVCCTEYRNRLPTYLRSAQKEVAVIDSILKKCESTEAGPRRAR